jgi:hypothetical protein
MSPPRGPIGWFPSALAPVQAAQGRIKAGNGRMNGKASEGQDVGTAAVAEIRKLWQVDDEWSHNENRGFSWWGQDYRQRIWSEPGFVDEGIEVFRLHAETDFVRHVDLPEGEVLKRLGALNGFASTAAVVFDITQRTVRLRSSMYVHEGTASWVPHTFSTAAIIQPIEAQVRGQEFAQVLGGEPDVSSHPVSGHRSAMDDMLNVIEHVYAPLGQKEPPWAKSGEFEETTELFNRSNSYSTADRAGLTGEFAWGENQTSMMTSVLDQPHPQLGNGVLTRLNLPLSLDPEASAWLAGLLNQLEVKSLTRAHLLGAWCGAEAGGSHTGVFVSFMPNAMYKPGLLTQMLISLASRARWAATVLEPDAKSGSVINILSRRYLE